MLTKRIVAPLLGAIALAGAALSVAPASAAPVTAGLAHTTQADTNLVEQAWHRGHPHYRGHPRYHRPIHRPRCFYEARRVWTGHGWVVRRVRVCR